MTFLQLIKSQSHSDLGSQFHYLRSSLHENTTEILQVHYLAIFLFDNAIYLQGIMELAWTRCLERHESQGFQIGVCGSWNIVWFPVPEKPRHLLQLVDHSGHMCISAFLLSQKALMFGRSLVFDISLMYLVWFTSTIIVTWQLHLCFFWQPPVYSVSDNGIKILIGYNKLGSALILMTPWKPGPNFQSQWPYQEVVVK